MNLFVGNMALIQRQNGGKSPVSLLKTKSNYAFNPIAEQALGSNQTIVPQRVNAALDVTMKTIAIRVSKGAEKEGREVLLPVSTDQSRLFELYMKNIERIVSTRLMKSGLPAVRTIRFEKDVGMTYEVSEFTYPDVWELLHVCRPVFLAEEPASFEKTLGYFGKNGRNSPLASWTKSVRSMYEKGMYQPYFQVSIGETPIFHEKTLLAWLNGVEYHQDPEKSALVRHLEEALGENTARGLFVAQLSGRISAILRLANVVEIIMEKYDGKLVSGGVI